MSDEEAPQEEEKNTGAPAWVMTFADLMSLLMCFFVLLLAFSEMDIEKYKQLAGSMKNGFGVQTKFRADQIPRGTSIIAKNFSPGKPEPTVIDQVRQKTVDENKKELDVTERYKQHQSKKELEVKTDSITKLLSEEIRQGMLEVDVLSDKIVIRILEKGSFPSAMAEIDRGFLPVIDKIRKALTELKGTIKVAGHTDSNPITTGHFRSNWELSSSRALSIVHALLAKEGIAADRFEVIGYGDTKPIAPNDTASNRSKNRRVDIILVQSEQGKAEKSRRNSILNDLQ